MNEDWADVIGTILAKIVFWTQIVFFILKVTRWIDWSWWAVFSPVWGYALFLVGLFALGLLLGVIGAIFKPRKRKSIPYTRPQDYNVDHIETLASIKNPRRS